MNPEQFTSAYQAFLESTVALSAKAFEGIERIVDLNLNVAKATLMESSDKAKELFSLRDPQDFIQFGISMAQPTTEKLIAYARHANEIVHSTRADLVKSVETQVADANKKMALMVDSLAKNAPEGSQQAVSMLKSAIAAANSAYESLNKATKQFVDITEANMAAATTAATNATVKAASQAASATKAKRTHSN